MSKRYGFYLDTSACTGCKACQIACKDKNDLPVGVLWRRVVEVQGGEWLPRDAAWLTNAFAYFISAACIEKFIALPDASLMEIAAQFPFLPIIAVVYLVAMPFLFFLPLASVHNRMLGARNRLLHLIGARYNTLQVSMVDQLESPDEVVTMESVDRLEALHRYFGMVKAIPVWPLDFRTVGWFVSTYATPILIPLLAEFAL